MKSPLIKAVLDQSFNELGNFTSKYKNEKRRYAFTIKLVEKFLKKDGRVLDIGTGAGVVPLSLKRLGFSAFGIEYFIFDQNNKTRFATEALDKSEKIKEKWSELGLTVYEKDVLKDDLSDVGKFDLVISEALIEHLKDPRIFLAKIAGLLHSRGIVIIATPNQASLINRLRALLGESIYWPINEFFIDGENFIGHWREYTISELKKMLGMAGFNVVEYHNANLIKHFKGMKFSLKNLRGLIGLLSYILPGSRDMNYVVGEKK